MAWYVVFKGQLPCVYSTWHECQEQVSGFCGASYKKYNDYGEAIRDFNSTINSKFEAAPTKDGCLGKPPALPPSSFSYKSICIVLPVINIYVLCNKISGSGSCNCN
jgi:hypothetical protein